MKKQLSMLAILVGASLNAQAAQSSFFTIVDDEVKGYASGISGDANGLIGLNTKNNMAEYFSTVNTPFHIPRSNAAAASSGAIRPASASRTRLIISSVLRMASLS